MDRTGTVRLIVEDTRSPGEAVGMRELSAREIGAALGACPGHPAAELRLLIFFQREAADRVEVQPNATPRPWLRPPEQELPTLLPVADAAFRVEAPATNS